MGEEQKELQKKEETSEEQKPDEPQDIVLKVDMHCKGCAKKVEKSLLRFEGVENVTANNRSKIVVVKSRTVDPAKVCERVQRKTKRRVELISPLPPPPLEEEEKKEETPRPPPEEEEKEQPLTPIAIILKVQMHRYTSTQFLEKQISKIEGVESVETDLPNDHLTVKGVMDPVVLVENVHKKTRAAVIVEEEKTSEGEKKPGEDENKAKDDGGVSELKKYESWPPGRCYVDYVKPYPPVQPYPYSPVQVYRYPMPQLPVTDEFSDENPNACTIV